MLVAEAATARKDPSSKGTDPIIWVSPGSRITRAGRPARLALAMTGVPIRIQDLNELVVLILDGDASRVRRL